MERGIDKPNTNPKLLEEVVVGVKPLLTIVEERCVTPSKLPLAKALLN